MSSIYNHNDLAKKRKNDHFVSFQNQPINLSNLKLQQINSVNIFFNYIK